MSLPSTMLWRRMPSPSVTPNELLEILTAQTNGYYVLPCNPYDEVFPGIILGDSTTALCLHLLRRLGVTHVLNAAWGKQRHLGMVGTSSGYYRNSDIEFYGIEALDVAVFPLFEHFQPAVEFISRAIEDGGKVLVHCGEGISRSSTLVIAYLMIKRGFRVQDAIHQIVKHRNILPNHGFLLQLCQLHDRLKSRKSQSEYCVNKSEYRGSNIENESNDNNNNNKINSNNSHNSSNHNSYHHINNHAINLDYESERARSMSPLSYSRARSSISPLSESLSIQSQNVTNSKISSLFGSSRLAPALDSLSRSPTPYREGSYSSDIAKYSLSSSYDHRNNRALSQYRDRCPSPILTTRTKWSNNWTPPLRSVATSSLLLSNHSPPRYWRYRRPITPYVDMLSTTTIPTYSSLRSRRGDSVDRVHTNGAFVLSDSYFNNSDRIYGTTLMSTYCTRPVIIR